MVQGLNVILQNLSRLMVLRTLYHADEPVSGREVERRTGLSNRATMLALDDLVDIHAVNLEKRGRANSYTLNRAHFLVARALRPAFDAEDMFWADVARTVQRVVRPKPRAAIATGPLVRDEADYGGRITLTILFQTGRARIKSLRSIQKLAERIRDRHSLTLDYQMLDLNTMDKEEYDPLWRRVEREGILLFGTLP
ncbi:MAG: hypothetical protein E4H02_03200 [Lentisphaerales bacterium]|nr:MAG: hypothetical protein E4H02_03200 [Lentisphaerales bacterium]